MNKLGAAFIVGGLLIAFGAVGGMEQQPEVPLIVHTLAALSGVFMMFVGTRLIRD